MLFFVDKPGGGPTKKRRLDNILPSITTSTSRASKQLDYITLEQLSTPEELANALLSTLKKHNNSSIQLALPDQLISSLRDRVLQHLLVLEPAPDQLSRLRHVLPHLLEVYNLQWYI